MAASNIEATHLRPVRNPDAADLVGDTGVGQSIDPSADKSFLPARYKGTKLVVI